MRRKFIVIGWVILLRLWGLSSDVSIADQSKPLKLTGYCFSQVAPPLSGPHLHRAIRMEAHLVSSHRNYSQFTNKIMSRIWLGE